MSLIIENARRLAQSMNSPDLRNLIAQSKAKQVLREVREIAANFPNFVSNLDDRVTFIAYGLLAAGCSLIERGETAEGYAQLYAVGDALESAHRTESTSQQTSALHCLIGAMAFYACGQYSRAFVLIGTVERSTPSAGIVASFLRKNRPQLIRRLNAFLLPPAPPFPDSRSFDDWALTVCIARAIALASEYAISGRPELLTDANNILNDAMAISDGASYPAFWWLARLLRLMLTDYGRGSLWSVLPQFFGPDGTRQISSYVKLLAFLNPPVVELWESQTSALRLALDTGNRGGVINLRTSAGKTRVAEIAVLQTLRLDPTAKVLYLAPFRSLAFELERTFTRTLAPLGYSVSHLYGGSHFSGVDREMVNEGNLTIATPEKAKAMLRADPTLFTMVKLVVIDEGHLLGGNERDVRNEMFFEFLRLLAHKHNARILLLSAVLPNATDLAAWIGGDIGALAKSMWKPSTERFGKLLWKERDVSIEWLGGDECFNPHFVEFKSVPKGKSTRMFPANKVEAVAATAVRLSELGPVLIFAGQAAWVPSMVRNVMLALGDDAPAHPWPETEWRLLRAVCEEELGNTGFDLEAARKGVISHSNKLPTQVRLCVEKLMAKYPPKVVVATTTLGQGVNIGVSSVIVASSFIGQSLQITKRDFWNICGRAGRAFVDGEGKILFAIDGTRGEWKLRNDEAIAESYFDLAHLDRVESGLLQVVSTLQKLANKVGISFELLLELAGNDEFDRCGTSKIAIQQGFDWIDDQLLALHVAYTGDDPAFTVSWVDNAFRDSLAAIQARSSSQPSRYEQLLDFLKARVAGVQRKIPNPEGRRAAIASGLPLSVAVIALDQLDDFRATVDRYLDADGSETALGILVLEFESWARKNATSIVSGMPDSLQLDKIRPLWLHGDPLKQIIESCGEESSGICAGVYGYQLPWIIHSIAQKLDKSTEESRVEALAKAGLLVELGLPTEAAAKIFLAGVRSRTAAIELSRLITNPSASVSKIRRVLLNSVTLGQLTQTVSGSTVEWLELLSAEHGSREIAPPRCENFTLDAPADVDLLHVRRIETYDSFFLCSTDLRFKVPVGSTEQMPFDKLANDARFAFMRKGGVWVQDCRDPKIQQIPDFFTGFV